MRFDWTYLSRVGAERQRRDGSTPRDFISIRSKQLLLKREKKDSVGGILWGLIKHTSQESHRRGNNRVSKQLQSKQGFSFMSHDHPSVISFSVVWSWNWNLPRSSHRETTSVEQKHRAPSNQFLKPFTLRDTSKSRSQLKAFYFLSMISQTKLKV